MKERKKQQMDLSMFTKLSDVSAWWDTSHMFSFLILTHNCKKKGNGKFSLNTLNFTSPADLLIRHHLNFSGKHPAICYN